MAWLAVFHVLLSFSIQSNITNYQKPTSVLIVTGRLSLWMCCRTRNPRRRPRRAALAHCTPVTTLGNVQAMPGIRPRSLAALPLFFPINRKKSAKCRPSKANARKCRKTKQLHTTKSCPGRLAKSFQEQQGHFQSRVWTEQPVRMRKNNNQNV